MPPHPNRTLTVLLWLGAAVLAVALLMRVVDPVASAAASAVPDAVRMVFTVITVFGTAWLWWGTAALLAVVFWGLSRRGGPSTPLYRWAAEAAALMVVAVGGSNIVVAVIKRVVGRARPYVELPPGGGAFRGFVLDDDLQSFPSGHADTFLAAAVVLSWLWPGWRRPILAAGLIGAASRVVLHVHFVSDVAVGGAIGVAAAFAARAWFANHGWMFRRGRDGAIRLKPIARLLLRRRRRSA